MPKSRLYLGTNTKMYKTIQQTCSFLQELSGLTSGIGQEWLELFVIPSYTSLAAAQTCVSVSGIKLGAQNMAWLDEGALTGEISPLMLKEVGVKIVEIGHSERRHILREDLEMIRKKVLCAAEHGFTVLLCVGETAREKEFGCMDEVLSIQLKSGLYGFPPALANHLWIAYEPVWAIGEQGTPASRKYAEARHRTIREVLCRKFGAGPGEDIPLLYGGSVCLENAAGLMEMEHIDGLFIGRSAWEAENFERIIRDCLSVLKAGK